MHKSYLQHYFLHLQKGAVLAEFAILIPFLLLLLIGIAEISFTYFHLNILNKSVQDAALYFSDPVRARKGVSTDVIDVSSSTNGMALAATENLVKYGSPTNTGSTLLPNGASINVTISCINDSGAVDPPPCDTTTQHIRVTANYNHSYILGNLLNGLCGNCLPNNQYPLWASSLFKVEGG
jgi:Flp pilus assembly protein TadG